MSTPLPLNWSNIVKSTLDKVKEEQEKLNPKPLEKVPLIEGNEQPLYFTPNNESKNGAWFQSNKDIVNSSDPKKKEEGFGIPLNFNHIFPSQVAQLGLLSLANTSQNSTQNSIMRFNREQFAPDIYLPKNPNTSQQALYGMEYGGKVKGKKPCFSCGGKFTEGGEYNLTDEQLQRLIKLGYDVEIL